MDHASIVLLRSVMAEEWRPESAGRQLRAAVNGDRRVLVLLRAKLSKLVLERPTRITERADLTLDHALSACADGAAAVPTYVPRQGGGRV